MKKVKTPQGFGRAQERARQAHELREDLKLQSQGHTIQRIGPGLKTITDPRGNSHVEARANPPIMKILKRKA